MDAISILNGIKNQVVNAKNYELLKSIYDLQNDNIEQLKTSNEVLKEDNERLREEVNILKTENESLNQTVAELTQRVSQLNGGSVSSGLSEVAVAILNLYLKADRLKLGKETDIIRALPFSTIQIESALDELATANMIRSSNAGYDFDSDWDPGEIIVFLTQQGKKYLANNK